jgi:hypothetical protein
MTGGRASSLDCLERSDFEILWPESPLLDQDLGTRLPNVDPSSLFSNYQSPSRV